MPLTLTDADLHGMALYYAALEQQETARLAEFVAQEQRLQAAGDSEALSGCQELRADRQLGQERHRQVQRLVRCEQARRLYKLRLMPGVCNCAPGIGDEDAEGMMVCEGCQKVMMGGTVSLLMQHSETERLEAFLEVALALPVFSVHASHTMRIPGCDGNAEG